MSRAFCTISCHPANQIYMQWQGLSSSPSLGSLISSMGDCVIKSGWYSSPSLYCPFARLRSKSCLISLPEAMKLSNLPQIPPFVRPRHG